MIAWHSYGLCWFTIGVKSSFGPVMTYPGPQSPLGIIGDQSPYPNECMGHGSLNVPIEHHPTIRYMVYNGYYKVMSNIPKVDSYHPLWDVHPFASLQSLIWAISRIHLWNFSIEWWSDLVIGRLAFGTRWFMESMKNRGLSIQGHWYDKIYVTLIRLQWNRIHVYEDVNLKKEDNKYMYMRVSWNGGTPKSSIFIGCSIINKPFWGSQPSIYIS